MIVNANSIAQHVIRIKNCKCKNYHKCKKNFSWNPSKCICENSKYLKIFADTSVTECNIIIVMDTIATKMTDIIAIKLTNTITTKIKNTITTNVTSTLSINCHSRNIIDCYTLHTVLLVIILLLIITITYYHYAKQKGKI